MVYKAEADGLRMLSEANPSENVLKLKGIDALKTVADGPATKIFMPTDLSNVISTLGVAGEALGIGNSISIDMSEKPKKAPVKDPCINVETSQGGREASETSRAINESVEIHD